ncbi:MAG: S-methyl-5'-thioadenosine phosphorylase, partial [Pseudomonadota bacterium]
ELCYATVAMVTDYDSWHPREGEVDVTAILAVLQKNTANAAKLIAEVAPSLGGERDACPHGCDRALEFAVITAPEARDPALVAKLDAVAGRVLA